MIFLQENHLTLHQGNCLDILSTLPAQSVDAIISDPPYAEVDRDYGRMSEADWHSLMREVVTQSRRILRHRGSAVFILQPNMEKLGRMRPWLWEFMAWTSREWNMVQDAYWWNTTAIPCGGTARNIGLLRPSVKACVWLGEPDCYRNQDAVLWTETKHNEKNRRSERTDRIPYPSGHSKNMQTMGAAALERGGVTPYNLLPFPNANSSSSGGAFGHGAATPDKLCDFWVRYLTPPQGTVLDMFTGTSTVGVSAIEHGHTFIGIEQSEEYCCISAQRLKQASQQKVLGLF